MGCLLITVIAMMCTQCPIDYSVPRRHYDANDADASVSNEYGGYTPDYFIGAYSSDPVLVVMCE